MAARHNNAIFFHPDAVEGSGRDLVGRRSAGSGFLKGWLAHAGGETLQVVTQSQSAVTALGEVLEDLGDTRAIDAAVLRRGDDFTRFGTVFFPAPGYQNAPWLRLRRGAASCSLVGVTHTVSTRRIIEGLHGLVSEPVHPWDAIICTSRAVQDVLQTQFDAEAAYMHGRFGAAQVPLPRLPVIPLGVDAARFAPDPASRAALRQRFGAPDDAVVVMTMGRLSVVEKANPLPLLLALEQAAEAAGQEVHLWLTGWTSRAEEEALYRAAIESCCTRVKAQIIDGRAEDVRRGIWSAADIFTLPSDSIQETFGLVPVEAMAAGLPVVMPDWDGFRDTVIDGETGFLVPTRTMPPGAGTGLAARFADGRDGYLQHLALTQSQVQIDVPAYTAALQRLIANADLRRKMGAQGAAHVRRRLDWSAVIPQYLALAGELADVRAKARPEPVRSPIEIDTFTLYRGYASAPIRAGDVVTLNGAVTPARIRRAAKLSAWDLVRRYMVAEAELLAFCARLEALGSASVAEIARQTGTEPRRVMTTVLILAKFDMVRITGQDGPEGET